jgi:tetratricopeptide (TPR) repeat protein
MEEVEQQIVQLVQNCKSNPEFRAALQMNAADNDDKGFFYITVGSVLYHRSFFSQTIIAFEEARRYYLDKNNPEKQAASLLMIGCSYLNLGDLKQSADNLEKALHIAQETGNELLQTSCYMSLATVHNTLGSYGKSLQYLTEALDSCIAKNEPLMQAGCYKEIGNTYFNLCNYAKALEFYEKSLRVIKEAFDGQQEGEEVKLNKACCYINLGNADTHLGEFQEALKFYKAALEIKALEKDRLNLSHCYVGLGNVCKELNQYSEALHNYIEALEIKKEIGDEVGVSKCYENIGLVFFELGKHNEGTEYCIKALELAKKLQDFEQQRTLNFYLALYYWALNTPESDRLAYEYCKNSIALSEALNKTLIEEEYKHEVQTQAASVFDLMIRLCIRRGQDREALSANEEALEFVEASKSRVFLDLLSSTEIKPKLNSASVPKNLLAEEKNLLEQLSQIRKNNVKGNWYIAGQSDRILKRLSSLYDELKKFDEEYVSLRRAEPPSFNQLKAMVSSPNFSRAQNVVVVEYYTTDTDVFIFVLSKELFDVVVVPLSNETLYRLVSEYLSGVTSYPFFGDGNAWRTLSIYLLAPISHFLIGADLIYFIPHGLIHYVPLHALEINRECLIEQYPVAYCHSASILKFCLHKGTTKLETCLSFGVDFEEEAVAIANLFKTNNQNETLRLGRNATKRSLNSAIQADILHFSCHGVFDSVDPLSSGIKLYDGILTVSDIFNLKLNAELVTLSACKTGLNKRSGGDELIGLTRAFMYAGTPSVIVGLWSVDSKATQLLMVDFYNRLKSGKEKAVALQEAQKNLLHDQRYAHPYYWAPFLLVGKP